MKLVIIESPFAGNSQYTEQEHREYLNRCILDCLRRNESPYASHKMLVDSLDDSNLNERALGIYAGFEFKRVPGITTVLYTDYGESAGMILARKYCETHNLPIEFRTIGKNP